MPSPPSLQDLATTGRYISANTLPTLNLRCCTWLYCAYQTRWARKGRNRWVDVEFEGGEGGDLEVESVAIAFFRGHRRIAFFDVSTPL